MTVRFLVYAGGEMDNVLDIVVLGMYQQTSFVYSHLNRFSRISCTAEKDHSSPAEYPVFIVVVPVAK